MILQGGQDHFPRKTPDPYLVKPKCVLELYISLIFCKQTAENLNKIFENQKIV